MSLTVITLEQIEKWLAALREIPIEKQDIYYTPEYYRLFEENSYGKARCLIYKKHDNIAIYPHLINSVNDLGYNLDREYYDIQGAYGYNGILYSSFSNEFSKEFSQSILDYCNENNIVAEFTRFNPILNNHIFSKYLSVIKTNKNIIVNLNNTEEDIWSNLYDRSVRKNVRKANRSGLSIKIFSCSQITNSWIKEFKRIYFDTLRRNRANYYYYFSDKYFEDLILGINNSGLFFFTLKGNKPISCELITYKNNNAYSFLGGTLSKYFPYRPNDFLKHKIILYLKSIGVKYFCLGGGETVDDGIYKYKKSFSINGGVNFYIGKKIYNKEIYGYLCQTWLERYPEISNKYSNMLLRYRQVK